MTKEVYLPILHHSTSPRFYNEVKIRLISCNLLDEISHISCQPKENVLVETLIGYTVIIPIEFSLFLKVNSFNGYLC